MKNDLTGLRFRKLVVLRYAHTNKHQYWVCLCDCGQETTVASNHLKKANGTASCGCAIVDHGEAVRGRLTPTYRVWLSMRTRCANPLAKDYKHYGGRGITVCPEWDDYTVFLQDMGERPTGRSIDRIDNAKGYEPGNCRWATKLEQMRNTRVARWIEFNGKRQILSEWAREFGTNPGQVHYWINKLGEEAGMNYLLRRNG